ncbi:DUF349 domain-containing protein [Nocardioides sp. Kera G14]|uniref:DUF349 domain-containing protein n=1 Tax=Nocardioides sp. Kera G14 TaxID=2884264 RepID=UPI002AB05ECC|nr:DUF349 domain-containing protein [Nocardioides sp. Kera G14]
MSAVTSNEWGRVDDERNVYVRVGDGERLVGQFLDGTVEEALAFYTDRYDQLAFEVDQLVTRVNAGKVTADEAAESVRTVKAKVADAAVVGDLAALTAKLDALLPVVAAQREARKAERAAKAQETRAAKEQIVAEAEKLATGNDWRNGANRLRELLESWKVLPRLDRAGDEELWKRFSSARTAYTRRRKSHFAELNEKRAGAQAIKEQLVVEAEALSTSEEWGLTAGRYRDLMSRWKAAGPAPKEIDDALWKRFRGAQDTFFGNRDAANAQIDAEFAANAEVKEAILVEAEALLPVTDLNAAKAAFRDLADRWDAAGKVPRDRIKDLEGRMRKVEQAIKGVEDEQWRKTDPEKSARADDMITKLEDAIAKIEGDIAKAETAGDAKKVKSLQENLEGRKAFLDMARRAAADFS